MSGADHIQTYTDTALDSGGSLSRSFCPTCGSTLTSENPKIPGKIAVPRGTMDQESVKEEFVPQSVLYGHNKEGWVPSFGG